MIKEMGWVDDWWSDLWVYWEYVGAIMELAETDVDMGSGLNGGEWGTVRAEWVMDVCRVWG